MTYCLSWGSCTAVAERLSEYLVSKQLLKLHVCLNGSTMAEQSLAAVLCQADRAVGLASARNGSKVLVTVQGDGVISYDTSRLVSAVQPGFGVCPVLAAAACRS
jgi:hypothetical protein